MGYDYIYSKILILSNRFRFRTRVLCGTTFRAELTGERIPTLREAVDLCEELDLLMFLDIKGDSQKVEEPVKVSLRELVQSQM